MYCYANPMYWTHVVLRRTLPSKTIQIIIQCRRLAQHNLTNGIDGDGRTVSLIDELKSAGLGKIKFEKEKGKPFDIVDKVLQGLQFLFCHLLDQNLSINISLIHRIIKIEKITICSI